MGQNFLKNWALHGIKFLLLSYNSANSRHGLIDIAHRKMPAERVFYPLRSLVNKVFWVCYNKWSQGVDHPNPCFQKPRRLCQNIRRSNNPQRLKLLQNTRGKGRRRLQIPVPTRCGERRFHMDSSPSDGCMAAPEENPRTQHGGAVTGMRGPRRITPPLTTLGTGLAGPLQ